MNRQAEHLYVGTIPACDCDPDAPRPVLVNGRPHGESCAIVVERKARLHAGTGGTR